MLEVLIVVAVFGLLATLAALSLRSAHMRLRDTQRLSDISALQSSLRQYWLEKATYPVSASLDLGRPGVNADALTRDGFTSVAEAKPPFYLNHMPIGPKPGEYYRYQGGANGYSLRFQTESDTVYGQANVYFAHAGGVDMKDEQK